LWEGQKNTRNSREVPRNQGNNPGTPGNVKVPGKSRESFLSYLPFFGKGNKSYILCSFVCLEGPATCPPVIQNR
jgi:hypothetical protein